MQTDLFSVSKLFTEALYRIPDYQRGYAWGSRQLKDFWSDLEQLEVGHNHYIGVLTLEDVPSHDVARWEDDRWIIEAKRFTPYYVVDGQQRLTTIIIFLQSLIERLKPTDQVNYTSTTEIRKKFIYESRDEGISRSYIFGYERDNPSYEFLKTQIFQERSDAHALPEETIYTHNLRISKAYFAEKLKDLTLAALEDLYTKVTQKLLFNVYAISREIDVFVAFETMNNRGKLLSTLELLKNRLIYLSTKLEAPTEERLQLRKVINESWKTIYHYLGKNKDRPLNDDIFLSTHHWLFFKPSLAEREDGSPISRPYWHQRIEDFKDQLLDTIFTSKNLRTSASTDKPGLLTVSYFYEYSHDIKEAVRKYYEIYNPEHAPFTDRERIFLERLRRLGDEEDMMLVLAIYRAAGAPEARIRLITVFEKVLFLNTISPYLGAGIELPKIAHIAARLSGGQISIAEIESEFTSFQQTLLRKVDFAKAIQQWSKGGGGYRWKGVRYFLYEYEQTLKSGSKTVRQKLEWEDFARERYDEDYVTVEHIFPQKSSADAWREAFEPFTIKEKNILKNSLGNLVPLSRPKNSALGTLPFAEKKSNPDNTVGYVFGCYSENEIAQLADWNAKEILLRGVRLLRFMQERWGVPLGDDLKKVSVMGLGFVFKVYTDLRAQLATTDVEQSQA
jgi:Protein of unknown function DUF262/Protein of unknown function (DUF1524)